MSRRSSNHDSPQFERRSPCGTRIRFPNSPVIVSSRYRISAASAGARGTSPCPSRPQAKIVKHVDPVDTRRNALACQPVPVNIPDALAAIAMIPGHCPWLLLLCRRVTSGHDHQANFTLRSRRSDEHNGGCGVYRTRYQQICRAARNLSKLNTNDISIALSRFWPLNPIDITTFPQLARINTE